MSDLGEQPTPTPTTTATPEEAPAEAAETRAERRARRRRHVALYAWSFAILAALVVLVALIVSNTEKVSVSWVFGDRRTSLIWVIVVSAIAGWLGGIATAIVYRVRTRPPRRRRPG